MNPQALVAARLQLHYAIQFMAASAAALVPPGVDGSHTTLEWNPQQQIFQTQPMPVAPPLRVALEPVHLLSWLLDEQGNPLAELSLPGVTIAAGFDWLRQTLTGLGIESTTIQPLTYPAYDFPFHPIAHGAVFRAAGTGDRQTLRDYFHHSHGLLQALMAPYRAPVRIWPHHFDLAALIPVAEGKSIGLGFSPGDSSYSEPYWYLYGYPYPGGSELPPLAIGIWHTQGWVGAVLTASSIAGTAGVQEFWQESLTITQNYLGVGNGAD